MNVHLDNALPGATPVSGRRFLYIECSDRDGFERTFDEMGEWIENADDQPSQGGLISENVLVRLLNGVTFGGLSFKGDVMGWARAIRRYASDQKLRLAEVKDGLFCIEGGESVDPSKCEIRFY